ncbi:MAG: hypothetical protein JWO62_2033, partial [Acidimicrobiaceae bacterium]|nr:hypothetical protein [Acidimicrobiaceae bacterium]
AEPGLDRPLRPALPEGGYFRALLDIRSPASAQDRNVIGSAEGS